jgi:hypothetical protein
MLGNFSRRSRALKQRVNKKQNGDIDSPASRGDHGKYMAFVNFPWPPLEAALSMFNFSLFLKSNFCEGFNRNKEIAISA